MKSSINKCKNSTESGHGLNMYDNIDVDELHNISKPNISAFEEIKIGKQIWMTKNLNVTRFRNGEQIPLAKSEKEWKKAVLNAKPAMCYYKFDIKSNEKYGILYNWYAVKDEKELAPEGWHIPSDEEWSILIDKCGGEEKGGELIKHTIGWDEFMDDDLESVDGNGNNKS